jgi:MoaA/NifB/PqqE/SkfB family radical SAM enzyme
MKQYTEKGQPQKLLVEVTNLCNHHCIFCMHDKMQQKFDEIDPDFLKRIMQEAYEMGVRRIGLYTVGEMFLCENISQNIADAKTIGFEYIYADTNGELASYENLEKVIDAGLDSIKFSINAGTRETYQQIHGHDSFNTVISNLRTCYELKQKKNKKLKILVSFVILRQNEKEIEILKQIVAPYISENVMINSIAPGLIWRYKIDTIYLHPKLIDFGKVEIPCSNIFERIIVTYNGYLTGYSLDFNHDLLLADLNNVTLNDAWNSENALKLRRSHLKKDLTGLICANCVTSEFQDFKPLEIMQGVKND